MKAKWIAKHCEKAVRERAAAAQAREEPEEQTEYVSAACIVFPDQPDQLFLTNHHNDMEISPQHVRDLIGEEIQRHFNYGLFTPITDDGDQSVTSEELDITRGYYHMHHNIPYLPSLDHGDEFSEYISSGHTDDEMDDVDCLIYEDEDDE